MTTKPLRVERLTAGLLVRLASFWIGVHFSAFDRRFCINLLPCITIWIALPGGNRPMPSQPSGGDMSPTPVDPCVGCQQAEYQLRSAPDLCDAPYLRGGNDGCQHCLDHIGCRVCGAFWIKVHADLSGGQ